MDGGDDVEDDTEESVELACVEGDDVSEEPGKRPPIKLTPNPPASGPTAIAVVDVVVAVVAGALVGVEEPPKLPVEMLPEPKKSLGRRSNDPDTVLSVIDIVGESDLIAA
jgi:hypothetical protein